MRYYTIQCNIPGEESTTRACWDHAMTATNCGTSGDYSIDHDSDDERAECDYSLLVDPPCGDIPPCARAMGCLCAGHARGNPADEPCDTDEQSSCTDDEPFLGGNAVEHPKSED